MKRNMLSIIIMALLIINIVLTTIMMFSMVGTNKKTAKLIDGISTALSLEIQDNTATEGTDGAAEEVSIEDIAVYKIEDAMTIGLAKGADGNPHYCIVSVSLSLNTKDPDYERLQPKLAENEDLIKDKIFQIIGSHSIEEADSNQDGLRQEILEELQKMYGSKFIYNIIFRDIMFS